jgi:hypothetical protein
MKSGLRDLLAALALIAAGWMVFDGMHGLLTGDQVRPESGEYAAQLGPWSRVVSALGIEPASALMMCIFVV